MELLHGTPYLLDESRAPRILQAIKGLEDEIRLLRSNGSLDEKTLAKLRQEWGIQSVHESAAIEGNQLTLNETEIAIQRGITISGKPPEHSREVQDLNEALQYLETITGSHSPISQWEIREVHGLVLGRAGDSGAFRNVEVEITNSPHKPPHPIKVQEQMDDYTMWLSGATDIPVPLLAAVSHAWLVHIHPFRDGNGRTARAILNLQLIRAGYPIVIIRRKDRERYYEALRASDGGDITLLLELIIERVQDSLRQVDRARKAVTGMSLALQKAKEQEERRYRIWADALRLFRSTFEDLAKNIESESDFSVSLQPYDLPSLEDFAKLHARDPSGNTWFLRLRLERERNERSILLWIGFSSDRLTSRLKLSQPIPSIRLSTRNPNPPPSWIEVGPDFPSRAREFVYHDGRFYRFEEGDEDRSLKEYSSVIDVVAEFLRELIEGWFVVSTPGEIYSSDHTVATTD
jgi:Fic family protein